MKGRNGGARRGGSAPVERRLSSGGVGEPAAREVKTTTRGSRSSTARTTRARKQLLSGWKSRCEGSS